MRKPVKVTAIEIMTLAAGVFGVTMGFTFMWTIVWIPWIYSYAFGIVAIVTGARLLASPGYVDGRPPVPLPSPPYFIGVMAIINILCCDFTSLTLGILILVFLGDVEVKAYYNGQWVPPPKPVPYYAAQLPPQPIVQEPVTSLEGEAPSPGPGDLVRQDEKDGSG